jgi:hypothetical protein
MKLARIAGLEAGAIVLSAMLLAMTVQIGGCSRTVENSSAVVEQVQAGQAPAVEGFFGPSASLLQPGGTGRAALVYVNRNVDWKRYTKIMIDPVQFWDGANSGVSLSDQQTLTTYAYNKLAEDLSKNFTLVNQPGPGVMRLQVALVNATSATPGLRSVSVVVPQLRILNAAQSLATGSYAFVGSAQAEMKATDSVSGQLLAGAVDQRAGGVSLSSAATWKWGDAEAAIDYWAQRISDRLLELQGRAPAASS